MHDIDEMRHYQVTFASDGMTITVAAGPLEAAQPILVTPKGYGSFGVGPFRCRDHGEISGGCGLVRGADRCGC